MKISTIALTSILFTTGVQAGVTIIEFTDDCDYDTVAAAVAAAGEDLSTWGLDGDEAQIEELCEEARNTNSSTQRGGGAFPFKEITNKGWQFDNNYFDGGTYLNEEYEPVEVDFDDIYDNQAQDTLITYPDDYIEKNFGDCQAQSVMCCWVQDRYDDGNNNGNCEQDDCKDADPADNTNVCYVEMEAGSASSHVAGGDAIFSRGNEEGDAHCHGFAWEDDETSKDYRYRGNLLFYVSMYDHLSARGYVREVPGAPMCGCVEQMPVVEESDCTEGEIDETYRFRFNSNGNHAASISDVAITYNACTNNELADRFDELDTVTEETREIFESYIVGEGNCDEVFDTWFEDKYGYTSDARR